MELDYRDSRPIYLQLVDRLRREILEGILGEGERLPSVRELAAQLAINPNTIQRAYRELEAQDWVVSIPGKGTFVRNVANPGAARQRQLLSQLDKLVAELETAGLSREEIISYLKGGVQP
ncbi:MAG: GntR family transcriptional regulator [Candidatus Faecousia sp.]|nr:GntR family transcriptional regulator [Bacillota bacterium]MDY4219797.1 GntR family transcriptional regulator [Candidatus Faecousia sp.]